jgi:hypothetical protein
MREDGRAAKGMRAQPTPKVATVHPTAKIGIGA